MSSEFYNEIRGFVAWSAEDEANLVALASLVGDQGAAITDTFYAKLAENPETAAKIEGRVDSLKQTHRAWMRGMAAGDYSDAYFDRQVRIGKVHVVQGIQPIYVEMVFSLLRDMLVSAIQQHEADRERALALQRSVLKLLDIDLLLINFAYAQERLDRLSKFTGFSRKLIENCINRPS